MMSVEVLPAVTGWLLFLAGVLLTGSVVARAAVAPGATAAEPAWLDRRTGGTGLLGALLMPVALGLVFHRQFREFRDPFAPWSEDASLLLSSAWGTSFKMAVGAAVVAVAAMLVARRGRTWGWWLAGAAAVVLAAFPGLTGHASGGDVPTRLTLPVDVLHVLAAGAWMGGLATVLWLEAAWRRQGALPASLLPGLVPRFSRVAQVAVGALLLTGMVSTWFQLPAWSDLWRTDYGRTLALKLGLVAVALFLGGLNWKRLTPRLHQADGPGAMRRAAAVELAVGTLILLVTAVLVRTSPTGH
ncbi:MAG: CopD family protein [Longimicrobiales bacterium]